MAIPHLPTSPPPSASTPLASVGTTLRTTWQQYNQHFSMLVRLALIGFVPQLLTYIPGTSDYVASLEVLVSGLLTSGLIYAFLANHTATTSVNVAWRRMWQHVGRYATTAIILGIIFFGLGVLFAGAIVLYIGFRFGGATLETLLHSNTFWTEVSIAILVVLLPIIYFGIRLVFAPYLVFAEKIANFRSLKRAWQLTRGQWWNIFRRFVVIFLLLFLLAVILEIASGPLLVSSSAATAVTADAVLTLIFSVLVSPFIYVFIAGLYQRLQGR